MAQIAERSADLLDARPAVIAGHRTKSSLEIAQKPAPALAPPGVLPLLVARPLGTTTSMTARLGVLVLGAPGRPLATTVVLLASLARAPCHYPTIRNYSTPQEQHPKTTEWAGRGFSPLPSATA